MPKLVVIIDEPSAGAYYGADYGGGKLYKFNPSTGALQWTINRVGLDGGHDQVGTAPLASTNGAVPVSSPDWARVRL